jgi:hypothetical protein
MKRLRMYPSSNASVASHQRSPELEPSRSGRSPMKRRRLRQVVLAVGAWATLMVGSSHAASSLTTPPIASQGNYIVCIATNVGTTPATVGVDVIDALTAAPYASVAPSDVDPFRSAHVTTGAFFGSGVYICRASGLSKTTGRVTICVADVSGNCLVSASTP